MFGFDNKPGDEPEDNASAGMPPVDDTMSDDTPPQSSLPEPDVESTLPEHGTDELMSERPSENSTQPNDDLAVIKNSALQQLTPLVGHLDQTPEEKFKTTMMMIQASDDSSLIPAAFEAAKSIDNEKTRAQALLDIVNEINYFTQKKN